MDSTDAATDFVNGLSNHATKTQHLELVSNMRNSNWNENCTKNTENVQVLVTGSLHLIGNVLSILDPSLNDE